MGIPERITIKSTNFSHQAVLTPILTCAMFPFAYEFSTILSLGTSPIKRRKRCERKMNALATYDMHATRE